MSDSGKARFDAPAGDRPGVRHLDVQMVQAEVSRIRASRFFRHSPRLARFLAFTVEKTLAGSAGDLKEYLIGVEVYGRRAGFDPKGDSIVRSEAVRLRHRLRQYYEVEGAENTLRISYPKGGYVPAFEPHPAAPDAPDRASLRICNTIAVLPFVNVGGTADTQAFGEGLAEELICGLGQVPGFRVVARSSSFAFQGTAVDSGCDPLPAGPLRGCAPGDVFFGTADLPNFYKRPYGEGWALVGDAGFHKDPCTAQGMSDAFHDAQRLATALEEGLTGEGSLAGCLQHYESARNDATRAMYELTCQMASHEPPPPEMANVLAALSGNQTQADQFLGIFAGTVRCEDFFSPQNVAEVLATRSA